LKKQRKSIKVKNGTEGRNDTLLQNTENIMMLTNSLQGSQNRTTERTKLKKGMTLPEKKKMTPSDKRQKWALSRTACRKTT